MSNYHQFFQAIIGKFKSHEHMAIYRLSVLMDIDIYCEFDCANLTENNESNQSRYRGKKKPRRRKSVLYSA